MKKAEASRQARRRLLRLLKQAQAEPALRKLAPGRAPWHAEVRLIGGPEMTRLNGQYRDKPYPTDILSFEAPEVFRRQGHLEGFLGELVICWPTLRRQAREQGHADSQELQILLVHGLLHLLGMDHERGRKEAVRQARWESRLLGRGHKAGLIARGV